MGRGAGNQPGTVGRLMSKFDKGLVIHLVCDWLLQNEWMAVNKSNPRHLAAWVHSGIHTAGLAFVFPAWLAVVIGLIHLAVDTRTPLIKWRHFIGQTTDPTNPATIHVAFWGDQVAHIAVLAIASEWLDG